MIFPKPYSPLDHLLGRVPKAYIVNCLACDYHEHLLVIKSHSEEPYVEGHIGMRCVKKLPKVCPKCGGKKLRVQDSPMPCD
jgi:hypothetical protein